MPTQIPENWLYDPPQTLVVGRGPYASSLAQIFGAGKIACKVLISGPESNEAGGYPRALDDLERVFLVPGTSQSPADALRCHDALWDWVGKLTSVGDQHELAIVFMLPPAAASGFEEALALGLCVPEIDPATTGHSVARMGDPLRALAATAAGVHPMDLLSLRARRAADGRHAVLEGLCKASSCDDPGALRAAAERVLDAFHGSEYHLDLFCRPPSHRHGNLLRNLLQSLVTDSVTPEDCRCAKNSLSEWLASRHSNSNP